MSAGVSARPSLELLEIELHSGRHGDHKRPLDVLRTLVGARHDHVALFVAAVPAALQRDRLADLVPRHELRRLRILYVFPARRVVRVVLMHVEANHAANHVLAQRLFPRTLRAAQRDLHVDGPNVVQFQNEFGVVDPGLLVGVALELLVVEVGPTAVLLVPSARQNHIHLLQQGFHLNWRAREN